MFFLFHFCLVIIIVNAYLLFQEAADIISKSPSALQLRYLQTLHDITNEHSSTVVFPIPGSIDPFFQSNSTRFILEKIYFIFEMVSFIISGEMMRGVFGEARK